MKRLLKIGLLAVNLVTITMPRMASMFKDVMVPGQQLNNFGRHMAGIDLASE